MCLPFKKLLASGRCPAASYLEADFPGPAGAVRGSGRKVEGVTLNPKPLNPKQEFQI